MMGMMGVRGEGYRGQGGVGVGSKRMGVGEKERGEYFCAKF